MASLRGAGLLGHIDGYRAEFNGTRDRQGCQLVRGESGQPSRRCIRLVPHAAEPRSQVLASPAALPHQIVRGTRNPVAYGSL